MELRNLVADALQRAVNPAFITDARGIIVWVNDAFCRLYGLQEADAIGQPPRVLKSGKHRARYYDRLWSAILNGREWSGQTVERATDGRLVTVRQNITPLRFDGVITHFLSIHTDVSEEADAAGLAQWRDGVDAASQLLTRPVFEQRCGEALAQARLHSAKASLVLMSFEHIGGSRPHPDARADSVVHGLIGARIHWALGHEALTGMAGEGDYAWLACGPEGLDEKLSDRISRLTSGPTLVPDRSLPLICRTAVAHFPEDGADLDQLLAVADRRLYESEPHAFAKGVPRSVRPDVDLSIERD